ncbi:MAG: hypothetical protein E7334_01240 [Clostridiales bacterium]|nr:hypothetical protein [Clostridiales bacterium]
MITAVPMIVIHTDVKGLVLINGRPSGNAGGALSLPAASFGDVFITVLPEGEFLPCSVKLSFNAGAPLLEDCEFEHIVWPDGISEIFIKCLPIKAVLPWEKIDSIISDGIEYALYKGSGLKLRAQSTEYDQNLFEYDIKDGLTGSVRELSSPLPCVGLLCDIEDGKQRLILLKKEGDEIKLLADESGTRLRIESRQLLCRDDLYDIMGHIKLTALSEDSGRLKKIQEEITVLEKPSQLDHTDTALALAQAVSLGLEEEAMGYLSESYANDLDFTMLSAFLGDFERAEKARYCPGINAGAVIALIKNSAKNAYTASVYAFEFENDKISLIKRYEG